MLPDLSSLLSGHRRNSVVVVVDDTPPLSYNDLKQRYKMRRMKQLDDIISDPVKFKAFHEILRNNQCGFTNTSVKESISIHLQSIWKENQNQQQKNCEHSVSTTSTCCEDETTSMSSDDSLNDGVDDIIIVEESNTTR